MNVTETYAALMAGNPDVYGADHGGCVHQPVTLDLIHNHLWGDTAIGIYPMRNNNVRWGCVDFDVKTDNHPAGDFATWEDAFTAARSLVVALKAVQVRAWPEITRSGGAHVWIFATDWLPARIMRRALLVACKVADVPTSEINPKQEQLEPNQIGNYVRLPYPHNGPADRRRVLNSDGTRLPLETFVRHAWAARTSPQILHDIALAWTPPPKPRLTMQPRAPMPTETLPGSVHRMIESGPREGSDRSSYLFRLALLCASFGVHPSNAYGLLEQADARWGRKFADRADATKRYTEIVDKAYR